jgi:hypothetical protein
MGTRAKDLGARSKWICPLLVVSFGGDAWAQGTLSSAGHAPIEQRVSLAIGPDRTTLWTSIRLDASAGDIGVIVPAVPGAALDYASAAWFEALDVASAPRVFPPDGLDATCPGDRTPFPFHVTTEEASFVPLSPVEAAVLPDAAGVALWASQKGLMMSPALANALGTFGGSRFVALRFAAPGGESVTATLRVVSPAVSPVLPLVLTEAGGDDLVVTTWILGSGRAAFDGSIEVVVDPDDITFDAATATSDYAIARGSALEAGGPTATVIECASHEALSDNVPIAGGTAVIEGVLTGYVERAAAYGDGLSTTLACISAGGAALASSQPVSPSCPRADLGIVDGVESCTESVGAGETDPELLRCGPGADDLAVGLSGLTPSDAWLTRLTTRIAAGEAGSLIAVSVPGGLVVDPIATAADLDLSECGEGGAGGAGAAGGASNGAGGSVLVGGSTSSSPGGGTFHRIPVYEYDGSCGCSGTYVIVDEYETEDESVDAYYRDDGGCSGDTETYEDESYEEDEDCGGEPSDTAESEEDSDCGGDTSETADDGSSDDGSSDDGSSDDGSSDDGSSDDGSSDDGSSDDSDEGCGSDTTESSESSDDGCGSDTSESSGSDDGCAVHAQGSKGGKLREQRPSRSARVRLSKLFFLTGLILMPLRRWTRRRRPAIAAIDR